MKSSGYSAGFVGEVAGSVAMGMKRSQINPATIHVAPDGTEEVETFVCAPGCPVAILNDQSGDRPGMSGGGVHREGYGGGMFGGIDCASAARNDSGGAARFFTTFAPEPAPFIYVPKPSRAEREFGCENLPLRSAGEMTDSNEDDARLDSPRTGAGRTGGARNHHPTLKSVRLATHLARLILPPPHADGSPRRLLNPFAGSGTECIGAMRAGFEEAVSIEQDADFVEIARARVARWQEVPAHVDPSESKPAKVDDRQASLFARTGNGGR